MKEKYLLVWPKSKEVTHINYHFSQFGEYITYLEKLFPNQILYKDGDIHGQYGYEEQSEILELIGQEKIKKVVLQITYENAGEAQDLIEKIKDIYPDIPVMGYGTIPRLYPSLFQEIPIDALASLGHDQKCIETFLRDYNNDNSLHRLPGIKVKDKKTNQWMLLAVYILQMMNGLYSYSFIESLL